MQIIRFIIRLGRNLALLALTGMVVTAYAGSPLWTFEPLTPTTVSVPSNSTAVVQYLVTNQSSKTHTLNLMPMTAVTQLTAGLGVCSRSFSLPSKGTCVLSLQIDGSQLEKPINDGPVVCQQGSSNQCYRPSSANVLHLTQTDPLMDAVISMSGSPLFLTVNGAVGQLTITNTSLTIAAMNIVSDFTGTGLDGRVTESSNNCAYVAPGASCVLSYTPGGVAVPPTHFIVRGANTNVLTPTMEIQSGSVLVSINPNTGVASGGTAVTLTGTGLLGTTAVTFGGVAATSVNVVDSTTVTVVTPAHATGSVDVTIDTPAGTATFVDGYTYVTTTVGQPSSGGIIACLNGGNNNLIAASADNSVGISWGGSGTATGANSTTDGASNTATIVSILGSSGGPPYAAQVCTDYEVDSQGNTPCQSGNACYSDWFLPAGNNTSGQLNCLYNNQIAIGGFSSMDYYWSSTEHSATDAWFEYFHDGQELADSKNFNTMHVRCVREFTP